jgi:hypothetical protein
VDASSGTLRELIPSSDHENRLVGDAKAFALWEIVVVAGDKTTTLSSTKAGPLRIERSSEGAPGLQLVWSDVAMGEKQSLCVVVDVWLDGEASRWKLTVKKPKDVRLREVRFPRTPGIAPHPHETLAVPCLMGKVASEPRRILQNPGKEPPVRLSWHYPWPLTLQCLAYYEPNGPGFYAACDDAQAYSKTFALWSDRRREQVHFEVVHQPEGEAVGASEFRLPYAVVLSAFRGDWITAAERYRESPAAKAIAAKGRLQRGLVPDWVEATGLWVWNRGRSEDVLPPAAALQKHVQTPVSVFWHWWHQCAYDAGFPEYLPPREGAAKFQAALEAAHGEGLHAILYMNQRLWGTTTESWKQESAEAHAVKGPDGKTHPESYNVFMKAPCAPMCIATDFWRNKYAGLVQQAVCDLNADGVYMDQTGVDAACYDPRHGHVVGPGRYWFEGPEALTSTIRRRCSSRGRIALGGEYCVEPVLAAVDMALSLDVGADRSGFTAPPWDVIPFFQAVYHPSTITFGNIAGLVYPPYDERWPPEKAPPTRLALLDRKFSQQFCLEQARTFVWGIQPMIANFRPELFEQRREEMDYLTRLVRVRHRALKYLLHGVWLRPPAFESPRRGIHVASVGTYTPLTESKREYSTVLAGAWRAPDGDVGVALASIHDDALALRLPIDFSAYGLGERCSVWRIDAAGRHRLGSLDRSRAFLEIDLPPKAIWVLEFCRSE